MRAIWVARSQSVPYPFPGLLPVTKQNNTGSPDSKLNSGEDVVEFVHFLVSLFLVKYDILHQSCHPVKIRNKIAEPFLVHGEPIPFCTPRREIEVGRSFGAVKRQNGRRK